MPLAFYCRQRLFRGPRAHGAVLHNSLAEIRGSSTSYRFLARACPLPKKLLKRARASFSMARSRARSKRFGALLRHEQALQLQALFDAEGGELIAGLGRIESAGGVAGAGERLRQQSPVEAKVVGDLALEESGTFEAVIGLIPARLGALKCLVAGDACRPVLRKELGIGGLGFLELEREAFAFREPSSRSPSARVADRVTPLCPAAAEF